MTLKLTDSDFKDVCWANIIDINSHWEERKSSTLPAFSSFECFCFCPSIVFEFFVVDSTMRAFRTARLWLILARLRFSINGLFARFGSPLSIFIAWFDVGANFMMPPPDDERWEEMKKKIIKLCRSKHWMEAKGKRPFTTNATILRGLNPFTEFKFVRFARVLFCRHVLCRCRCVDARELLTHSQKVRTNNAYLACPSVFA